MLKLEINNNTLHKVKQIKKTRYLSTKFISKLEEFFSTNFVYSIFDKNKIKNGLDNFLSIELPDINYEIIIIDDFYSDPNPSVIIKIDEFDFEVKIKL